MSEPIPQFAREEHVPEFHLVTDKSQTWVFPNGVEWTFTGAELTDTTLTLHKPEGPEKFILEERRQMIGGSNDSETEFIFVQLITGERAALKRSFLEELFGQVIPKRSRGMP